MGKSYPQTDRNGDSYHSRAGAKLTATVLNVEIFRADTIQEKKPTEELKRVSTREEREAANKEAEAEMKKAKEKAKKKGLDKLNHEWKERKEIISETFIVGPIPLSVTAGIDGSIALNTSLNFEGIGVVLDVNVPAHLTVFLQGGIGKIIAEAGVKGNANLIDTLADANIRAGLTLNDSNELSFGIHPKVTLDLNILQAALEVYAKTKTKIAWCSKHVLFATVWYPCGLDWDEWSYFIYKTPWLFHRKWIILDEEINALTVPLN